MQNFKRHFQKTRFNRGNEFEFTDSVPSIKSIKNQRSTSVLANTLYKKSVGVQTIDCCYVQYGARFILKQRTC